MRRTITLSLLFTLTALLVGCELYNRGENKPPQPNPNEGGNESGTSFQNWVFDASLDMASRLVTLTDGSHTVVMTLSEIAGGTFYLFDNGALNVTAITVNGIPAESASGTMEMSSSSNYYIVLDCTINGVKYTGTSNNPVVQQYNTDI